MNEENSWFKVVVPHFENANIGEVYGTEENVIGRKIACNASEFKDLKPRIGYRLIFRIVSASESECKAEIDSVFLSREQTSRLVRHNVSKMDVVVPVTIEGKRYAIKVLCAISKAKNEYRKSVRREIHRFAEEAIKEAKIKDVVVNTITNKMQNELHKRLSKIYPTRAAEIRAITPRA